MFINFNKSIEKIPENYIFKIFPDVDVTVTGALLRSQSGKCASWLQKHNYKKIEIHMGNCPEFLYLFAGAMRAGIKVSLSNALNRPEGDVDFFDRDRVSKVLNDSECDTTEFSEYEWELDEPLISITTSGTSGEKKTIEKSAKNIFGRKGLRPILRFIIRILRVRLYNCSPWYHNTGILLLIISLSGGLFTEITANKFNPNNMRLHINKHRPQAVLSTPTMLTRCVNCGELLMPSYILCTGEPLSTETIEQLENNKGGQVLYNGYGTTETGAISKMIYTFNSIRFPVKLLVILLKTAKVIGFVFNNNNLEPNCVGSINKYVKIKIMKDGHSVPEGERGNVCVHSTITSKNIQSEYYNTGDIGYVNGNLLFIEGRSTNVINRSGEKIIPSDIEKVIANMDGVQNVVVFGTASKTHGEDICAAIESEGGTPVIDVSDLKAALPKYMVPNHLRFFDKFPLNKSGKTDIAAIKEYFGN